MPRGTYGGGEIELYVFAEDLDPTKPADQAILDQWKKSFEVASCMLFHATDKQAHFAKIHLYTAEDEVNDPDNFDARVSNTLDSSYALGHPAPGCEPEDLVEDPDAFLDGTFMELGKDAFEYPFVILHEFGHFGYWLGDEYFGEKPTQCTEVQQSGPPPNGQVAKDGEHSCIMGVPTLGPFNVTKLALTASGSGYSVTPGWIVEFCNKDNHDDSNGSNHNSTHQGYEDNSCKNMIAEFRDITVATNVAVPKLDGKMDPCSDVEWPPTTNDSETDCIVDSSLGPAEAVPIDDIFEAGEYGMHFASATDRISLLKFGDSERGPRFKPMPGIAEALEALDRKLTASRKRPAIQSLLLFSTGRERIPSAHETARSLARKGVRVFSFGLGQADRAGLQQLAQRTGGAYFEVGVNDRQRSQLLRAEMARAYDGTRFGAPISIVPREKLGEDEVRIPVEEGSRLLKLVFAKTPGSNPAISVRPPPGRQRLERILSESAGFEIVTAENPLPGDWIVSVAAGSLPDAMELSAYSDNRRISVGVSGRRRLRLVGETVTLQVVVRAPFAVVDLDTAEVRVTPPGGSETHARDLRPRRDGVHVMQFRVTEVGAYDVEVLIRNRGGAKLAGQRGSSEALRPVPLFERTRRFQIHVTAPQND